LRGRTLPSAPMDSPASATPASPPPPPAPFLPQPGRVNSGKAGAEEPFVLAAMVSLQAATVWLNLRPNLLLQFFYSPETLALTHLVTLGFASAIILGVMQRLAPHTFGYPPPSRKAALWQCAFWLLGAAGMVFHFWLERWIGLLWAAFLVLAAILWQCVNHRGVFARALRRDAVDWGARWVALSLVHFALAAALGCLFALARVHGVGGALLTAPLLDRLAAHFHLASLGWIGGAIFGYQLRLLPGTRASGRVEALRFVLLQGGLLALAGVLMAGAGEAARWCALPIAAAIALRSVPVLLSFGVNRPGRIEIAAHGLLLLLAAGGLALTFGHPAEDDERRLACELAYAYVALFGWILLTVLGTSWKLFSVWVWQERYAADLGRRPVPAVAALPSAPLRHVAAVALAVGVLGVAVAIVVGHAPLLRIALGVQLLGTLAFLGHFLSMARHELFGGRFTAPR